MSQTEPPPTPAIAAGFDDFYRRERPGMVRLAYLVVGSAEIGEEIVQDAFVEVHRRFAGLDHPGAYLRTTVVNRCRTAQRRASMERNRLRIVGSRPTEQPTEPDPIWDALATLNERQRTALVLTYYGQLTSEEAAEAMGCRPATVRSLSHRGLQELRKVVTR